VTDEEKENHVTILERRRQQQSSELRFTIRDGQQHRGTIVESVYEEDSREKAAQRRQSERQQMPCEDPVLAEETGRKLRMSLGSMLNGAVKRGFAAEIGLTHPRYRDSVEEGVVNIPAQFPQPLGVFYSVNYPTVTQLER